MTWTNWKNWKHPEYEGASVLELETLNIGADHPDEMVRQWREHVLMLTLQVVNGHEYWGVTWLARNGDAPWHQVMRLDGPSADRGDNERKLIREYRERITRRVS